MGRSLKFLKMSSQNELPKVEEIPNLSNLESKITYLKSGKIAKKEKLQTQKEKIQTQKDKIQSRSRDERAALAGEIEKSQKVQKK